MWLKFCVDLNKISEVTRLLVMTVFFVSPCINRYNWEGIEFPAGPKDWKKFERNNKAIALNISFALHNTETIRVAYRSEYIHKRKKQVILLMITDGKNSIILL